MSTIRKNNVLKKLIKKYDELGMGISIATDISLTENDKLVHIPLKQHLPQRGHSLVLHRGRFLSPQARRFVEILNEVYGHETVLPDLTVQS
jgi:DNA-binding transcriptional LysR family regulator